MSTGQLILTWDQFHKDTRELGEKLKALGPWDGIIAVARGGLVPATVIAHMLEIQEIETISISSYDARTHQYTGHLDVSRRIEPKAGRWVVIDELVDTGRTSQKLKEIFPWAFLACVYAKPQGQPFVDLFVGSIPQNEWIVFPWEI